MITLLGSTACAPPTARDVAVWVVEDGVGITYDSAPDPANRIFSASRRQVQLVAARNETIAFQVVLQTKTPPAGPCDVSVSDLAGPAATLRARDVVQRFRAPYAQIDRFPGWYPDYLGRPALPTLVLDVLVPWDAPTGGGAVLLGDARPQVVWVDLAVPATVPAGVYRGKLAVTTGGATVLSADLAVEVLPVALPDERSLPILARVDPRDLLTAHFNWPRVPAEETRIVRSEPSHAPAVALVDQLMSLLQEHRLNPMLWASFPPTQPEGQRGVKVDWTAYDALVAPWLSGQAFADRVPLALWPLPVDDAYPPVDSPGETFTPRAARLLASYLSACRTHFAEQGWLPRTFVRPYAPRWLSNPATQALARFAAVLRQSEVTAPLVAHLPPRSPAGLGWHGAPPIDLPDVGVWSPPAMTWEADALSQARVLGRRAWWLPDRPPYSASLSLAAPANDARLLPWQAYRYAADALWIEDAADGPAAVAIDPREPWRTAPLVMPGLPYGLRDRVVPTMRLKRLRRGAQDYALLRLLEANGRTGLAQEVVRRIVPWAGADAGVENLLAARTIGWETDPAVLSLARELLLRELAGTFVPQTTAADAYQQTRTNWSQLLNPAQRIAVAADGVRLRQTDSGLVGVVAARVANATDRPVRGRWQLSGAPPGLSLGESTEWTVAPGARQIGNVPLRIEALGYNAAGAYPFELVFDTDAYGAFPARARIAVATCLSLDTPPQIDGALRDWPLASTNMAADFRLCRWVPIHAPAQADTPALPTQAFFARDADFLYVGVRCTLPAGQQPVWTADNRIPVFGGRPWGQDVVEILLDPSTTPTGPGALYCLQIKPSGFLRGLRGAPTDPPIGPVTPWNSDARVAVQIEPGVWVVELAIPWSAFSAEERAAQVWGFDVTRLDTRTGEYSTWSASRGYAYAAQTLGNLLFLGP